MRHKQQKGYTLIELMMVVIILGLLASMLGPHYQLILTKAYQAKTKGNLGMMRAAINIYYSDMEGNWPFAAYPIGDSHYTADNKSLTTTLVPKYTSGILTPFLHDANPTYNGLSTSYDTASAGFMSLTPPKDIYIVHSAPAFIPLLNSPFAYNSMTGHIFIPNGNYDANGEYFFSW